MLIRVTQVFEPCRKVNSFVDFHVGVLPDIAAFPEALVRSAECIVPLL